ncbi:unnamed protein product, partial [Rotaria sordida]
IGIPLRPIVSSMRAPATGISHFLDQVLRPIFDRAARQTTFINGIHFVRRMELYRDLGRLSSTTTLDDVFMTTNLPLHEINLLLDRANSKDENIRITRTMGTNVEFLDVTVTHNQGQLKTTVFHKPAAEPNIVPFLSDRPRHIHRNTIKGAL